MLLGSVADSCQVMFLNSARGSNRPVHAAPSLTADIATATARDRDLGPLQLVGTCTRNRKRCGHFRYGAVQDRQSVTVVTSARAEATEILSRRSSESIPCYPPAPCARATLDVRRARHPENRLRRPARSGLCGGRIAPFYPPVLCADPPRALEYRLPNSAFRRVSGWE